MRHQLSVSREAFPAARAGDQAAISGYVSNVSSCLSVWIIDNGMRINLDSRTCKRFLQRKPVAVRDGIRNQMKLLAIQPYMPFASMPVL